MIYCIKGEIKDLNDNQIYIENNGIIWEIIISKKTYENYVSIQDRSNIKIYTYLNANEKGIQLYGFYSLAERSFFLNLQKVSGIGPKAAIKILSSSSPEILLQYIKQKDIKNLSSLPSVGSKKAANILLALEGTYIALQDPNIEDANTERDKLYDVKTALIRMGYELNHINQAIHTLQEEYPEVIQLEEGKLLKSLISKLESDTF